eukprot:g925.t1
MIFDDVEFVESSSATAQKTTRGAGNFRHHEQLAELLKCPGSWRVLSDDEDEENDEMEKASKEFEVRREERRQEQKDRSRSSSAMSKTTSSYMEPFIARWFSTRTAAAADSSCRDGKRLAPLSPRSRHIRRRREAILKRSAGYERSIRNALEMRRRDLDDAESRQDQAREKWNVLRSRIFDWCLPMETQRCFDKRWILVQQRLELTIQLAKSAVSVLERRLVIATSFRESHAEDLVGNEDDSANAGEQLDEDERSLSLFVIDTPRILLRRDEQREGMKDFVSILDRRIRVETEVLFSQHDSLLPLPKPRVLAELRTLVERTATMLDRWNDRFANRKRSDNDEVVGFTQGVTSRLRDAAETDQNIASHIRTASHALSQIVLDMRKNRGQALRRSCDALRSMYVGFLGHRGDDDLACANARFSTLRVAMLFSRRFGDLLAREIWSDPIFLGRRRRKKKQVNEIERKTSTFAGAGSMSVLRHLVEAVVFGRIADLWKRDASANSSSRRRGSVEDERAIAWLRNLPLNQLGFDDAMAQSIESGIDDESSAITDGRPLSLATASIERIVDVPASPAFVVSSLLRSIRILFLEVRSKVRRDCDNDETSRQPLDTAEILLPSLIVSALHLKRMSTVRRVRAMLAFAKVFVASHASTKTRCDLVKDDASVVIRSGEVEYYVVSMLAALRWIESQEEPATDDERGADRHEDDDGGGASRTTPEAPLEGHGEYECLLGDMDGGDYEGLLEAFTSAAGLGSGE